jgi:hypothetical protein
MRSRIAAGGGWIAVVFAIVLVAGAGCYLRKYDKLARTHVVVLLAMTQKIEDLTERDGNAPAALGEYRYPLERAQDFARIAARRFEGHAWLRLFADLCAAYERLLATAERLRASGGQDAEAARALADAAAAVRAAATEVEQALDRERDGKAAASGLMVGVSTV